MAQPAAASRAPHTGPVPVEDLFRLRALPNEDVFFYCKRIDNSRVVREPDPRAGSQCWSTIGVACVVAALLVSVLIPGVANVFAGYQLQALKQEEQRLLNEQRVLDVQEAALVSRERLEALARSRDLRTPAPGQVIRLDPRGDGKLALNRH
jgi:cell division protein FtsL